MRLLLITTYSYFMYLSFHTTQKYHSILDDSRKVMMTQSIRHHTLPHRVAQLAARRSEQCLREHLFNMMRHRAAVKLELSSHPIDNHIEGEFMLKLRQ